MHEAFFAHLTSVYCAWFSHLKQTELKAFYFFDAVTILIYRGIVCQNGISPDTFNPEQLRSCKQRIAQTFILLTNNALVFTIFVYRSIC
jgi:succinate dehydrogenase hydrophobic anchor subunit